MLQAFLLYLGDTQREGTFVTRRIKSAIILRMLAGLFFLIAVIAAGIGGSIYLAKELGAGPAALVIAAVAFLLGVIMLVILAIVRRPTVYRTPVATPLTAAPLAAEALAAGALVKRPFTTLLIAVALGFITTRVTVKKK
ncbi:hypothetical protein G6L28_17255 [Agrobacterium larrymoorei]|uniref:hypothetical protein n=1 Tax=Agrobacterium larrymoorei TaxID=160699 RepID=UPI001573FD82|nr:hypothetical protein [Agrobacterium larrymoorei]NTJ44346.1 hypothetical protein [Agrobacterium larrymoorei]